MSRTKLGIFDTEIEYVQRLGAYIMLNERENLEAHLYSELEKLMVNLEDLDIVLVPEDFSEIEDDGRFVRMVERKDLKPSKQIFKYQKASTMLSEVKRLFSINEIKIDKQSCNIICVESPVRHELQMLYSMCLCKEMSINEKTLYINLRVNSGFVSLFQSGEEKNLEDLFLGIDDEFFSLESYVQSCQGIKCIAPVRRPELLWEIDESSFERFVMLMKNSSYDSVVIDTGSFFPEYYHLLEKCDEIILLGKEGFLSEHSKKEYLDNLSLHMGEEFLKKVQEVILPLSSVGIWESQFLLDDLFRGNLGDYVREGQRKDEGSC